MIEEVRNYWNENIHDFKLAKHPVGTRGFFDDLAEYHFEKLNYLLKVVDSVAYRNKKVLEIGCGLGIDLVKFAENGAIVIGIDIAGKSIELAKKNFEVHGLKGSFEVMDAGDMKFEDNSFDVVFAQGMLQYAPNPEKTIAEVHRVLKQGGVFIFTVYNRHSWLNLLSKVSGVELEHVHAPVYRKYSFKEIKHMLKDFSEVELRGERFPVPTRLHHDLKAAIYNKIFIRAFNLVPRKLISRFGWHIVGKAVK